MNVNPKSKLNFDSKDYVKMERSPMPEIKESRGKNKQSRESNVKQPY